MNDKAFLISDDEEFSEIVFADCYNKNRYNILIRFRFAGARYDACYCAGCGNILLSQVDLPAWEKTEKPFGPEGSL